MIAEHPAGPGAGGEDALHALDGVADRIGVPGAVDDVEVERDVDLVLALTVVLGPTIEIGVVQLPDADAVPRIRVEERAEGPIQLVHVRVVVVVHVELRQP